MSFGSEWYYFEGKYSWVQAHKPDKWDKWSHVLHLTPKSLEDLRELIGEKGLKTQIKKDDDGWFTRFRRPTQLTLRTGKIVGMTAPELFDGNQPIKDDAGNIIAYAPLTQPVGNGSDGVTKCELYPYTIPMTDGKKGYALRWHSSRIDNLVLFNKPSFTAQMEKDVMGLPSIPAQQQGW